MTKSEFGNLLKTPLSEIICMADRVRRENMPNKMELCSILNAKSGKCSEDCKFCAQSSRHKTGTPVYDLKNKDEMVSAAKTAIENGAKTFGIVTSGNSLKEDELNSINDAIKEIKIQLNIEVCASLGSLSFENFIKLKQAGLFRYHHNIETSPSFYPKIVTTHPIKERIDTIKAAKKAGLQVCSGGIIGMGETWQDRFDMALLLKDLEVDSVPLNILMPIKGTPLADQAQISCPDVIRTIAIFRIILKDKVIKVAAGRESALKDFQAMAFMAGANGMLIGGYLTVNGRDVSDDKMLVKEIETAWNQ
ncbi:MAG: biotin synthase BioB [bacterium]